MKKLLTVLLTFVMAICLINLNYNHTKAEDNPTPDYTFTYSVDAQGGKWASSVNPLPETFVADKTYSIQNNGPNAITVIENGASHTLASGSGYDGGFNHGGTVILDPVNAIIIITDLDPSTPVPCVGISFDGTDWKLGNTVINSTQLKNTFGITYTAGNPAKVTLKKSLKLTKDNTVLLWLKANIDIELENNVTLDNDGKNGFTLKLGDENIPINVRLYGKGHTLSLNSKGRRNFRLDENSTLNLYNVKIDATTVSNDNSFKSVASSEGYIKFDDKSELQATITGTDKTDTYAMASLYDPTFAGDYEILGTADGVKNDLKTATRSVGTVRVYQVDVSGTATNANYVVIRPKLEKNPCSGTTCNVTTEKGKDATAYITDFSYDDVITPGNHKVKDNNGTELNEGTDYKLSPGSVYVTINKEYLAGLAAGTYNFEITLNNGTSYTYPLTITIKEKPTPSPEPQPKDESCEKVIGPTWHWNNDKGVCEEYATVGTSTR